MITPNAEAVYITALLITIFQIIIFFTNLECEIEGWGKNALRNISYFVTDVSTPLVPMNFCASQFMLLIVVSSAPANKDARQAIRETWGSQKILGENINLVFFLGNPLISSIQDEILMESDKYNDIVQEDFLESYNNLTLKSLLIMKLVTKKCLDKGRFLLKIDDDMFLNVDNLMKLLIQRNNSENLLIGRKMCSTKTIRDPLSKWYTPRYLYSKPILPDFLSGTGYLMSLDVTEKLYQAAMITPFLHLEDVYITGLCAENAGIVSEFNPNFSSGDQNDENCQLKDLIAIHEFPPDKIRNTFQALNNPKLSDICANYEPMFNAGKWMKSTIFAPLARMSRQMIC